MQLFYAHVVHKHHHSMEIKMRWKWMATGGRLAAAVHISGENHDAQDTVE